jgi:hypothetical protein
VLRLKAVVVATRSSAVVGLMESKLDAYYGQASNQIAPKLAGNLTLCLLLTVFIVSKETNMFPNRFLKPAAIRRTIIRSETGGASKFPKPLRTAQKGIDILHDPLWNKGMGFPFAERDRLGLRGLLPPIVKTMEAQLDRAMRHVSQIKTHESLSCHNIIYQALY